MPDGIGFPTLHDADGDFREILPHLIPVARERGGWIGVGMTPDKRHQLGGWLTQVLAEMPNDLHVHGWALRRYWLTHGRLDSVDSTNWWRDSHQVLVAPHTRHLTQAEAVDIVVKRYRRERRTLHAPCSTGSLFGGQG